MTSRRSTSPRERDEFHGAESWLVGDNLLARKVGRPLVGLVRLPAAAGMVLAAGVVAGLIWANSPWRSTYGAFWSTEIVVRAGPVEFAETLRATVNDAAMVLFFFAIGLEVKRELVAGSLRHPKAVALPVAAALGGMLVPAGLYALATAGTPALHGWAIPMATDTALALGVAALAAPALPRPLLVFLLSLAVVDDIAVVLVIATFYTDEIHLAWLLGALATTGLVLVLRRARVWHVPVYVAVGTVVWYCVFRSGVHATMAGVVLGLLTPARPLRPRVDAVDPPVAHGDGAAQGVRHAAFALREQISVAKRLHHVIQPWVGFAVLPLFAVANAGISLSAGSVSHAMSSRVAVAVVIARLVGKPLGIIGAAWVAYRLGLAHLPDELRWRHVAWIGILGAIGFTVSVYVSTLSFSGALDTDATLAIMTTTAVAAVVAAGLWRSPRKAAPRLGGRWARQGAPRRRALERPAPEPPPRRAEGTELRAGGCGPPSRADAVPADAPHEPR